MMGSLVERTSPTTGTALCRQCGQRTTLKMAQFRDCSTIPVTCDCGHVIRLVRHQRRYERKAVQLTGALLDIMTHAPLTGVTLVNLSRQGAGLIPHQYGMVEVEDLFRLMFRLDDSCQTVIEEDMIVRRVEDSQYVGVEFLHEKAPRYELDFYLTPWVVLL